MSRIGLPAGTLGFVFAAIAVVCTSTLLESNAVPVVSACVDEEGQELESAAPVPLRRSAQRTGPDAVSHRRMTQSYLFESDLRNYGLNLQTAVETAWDNDTRPGAQSSSERLLSRLTQMASLRAATGANASEPN